MAKGLGIFMVIVGIALIAYTFSGISDTSYGNPIFLIAGAIISAVGSLVAILSGPPRYR